MQTVTMNHKHGLSARLTRLREGVKAQGSGYVFQRLYNRVRRDGFVKSLLGDAVVRFGHKVRIDGCRFDLHQAGIQDNFKINFSAATHERPERNCIDLLNPDLDVIELGGSIGILACLMNRRLSRPDRHIVVEAVPDLVAVLEKHREMNDCRYQVVHSAVAYGADRVEFLYTEDPACGRIASADENSRGRVIAVPTLSIADLIARFGLGRCAVVMDIEGGELEVFRREADLFAERVEQIVVEFHPKTTGEQAVREAIRSLGSAGFEIAHQEATTWFFQRTNGASAE